MAGVGSFMSEIGEREPYDDAPAFGKFRVTRSDSSSEVVEALDEADAIRQAGNGYTGPAIVIQVVPYTDIPARRNP